MKKRNSSILLCIILCVSLLSGCGGEYAGLTEGDAVSGSAVSGEAVSGDAIREKTVSGPAVKDGKDGTSDKKAKQDMSSHRFCTDTNLYYISYNEEKLMQARTDGTHRKCIKEWPAKKDEENCVEIVYADENWLYYDVVFDWAKEITYRAPIEKDAQGYDVIKISKEEELVKTGMMIPMYADSDYYFYEDLDTDKVIKYDLKRKRKDSEIDSYSYSGDISHSGDIFRIEDYYVMMTDDEEIYIQNIDSAQWRKVSDYENDFMDDEYIGTHNAKAFFYLEKENDLRFSIKRHDGKQETDFVTWQQLDHAVKKAVGVEKLDVCMINHLFWQEGRLYVQIQTGWMKDGIYHMGYMIFSQGEKEDGSGSGLRYEKELTECMKSHVKERTGKWSGWKETVYVEHMVVNDAQCIAMVEGKAYLSLYDYGKNKGRLGCYDLDTGKFEWIDKQDAAFYKLGYDCGNPHNVFGEVFDEYLCNVFVDDWWSPSKDKNYEGEFKEDRK